LLRNQIMSGKFIVFEGIDGSGKSTQSKLLFDRLQEKNVPCALTAEPSASNIGKLIRSNFSNTITLNEHTVAGLFLADRLEHILNEEDGILKTLASGVHVICDRYYLSSYAYHGVHVDMDWVIACNAKCAELAKPDLHLFIDVNPEMSMERISASRETTERYETLENLKRVRQKYLEAIEIEKSKENIHIIDGNKDIKTISDSIYEVVSAILPVT